MKSIQRKDFIEVGSAVKVHGTRGELKFMLTREIKLKEWAFLEFRGKPVPFYVEFKKADLEEEVILKLQGINSVAEAQNFIGRNLLLPVKAVKKQYESDELQVEGFTVKDKNLGSIGIINEVVEMPYQSLAKIIFEGKEVFIPLVEGIVLEIDEEQKILQVNLPEGILNIN